MSYSTLIWAFVRLEYVMLQSRHFSVHFPGSSTGAGVHETLFQRLFTRNERMSTCRGRIAGGTTAEFERLVALRCSDAAFLAGWLAGWLGRRKRSRKGGRSWAAQHGGRCREGKKLPPWRVRGFPHFSSGATPCPAHRLTVITVES